MQPSRLSVEQVSSLNAVCSPNFTPCSRRWKGWVCFSWIPAGVSFSVTFIIHSFDSLILLPPLPFPSLDPQRTLSSSNLRRMGSVCPSVLIAVHSEVDSPHLGLPSFPFFFCLCVSRPVDLCAGTRGGSPSEALIQHVLSLECRERYR